MKNTFANARENLSDEQLKHVTGGARVNSRPEAAETHLIDHDVLHLHGVAAADGHSLAPPEHSLDSSAQPLESLLFSPPFTVPGLHDSSGHAITLSAVYVFTDGSVSAYDATNQSVSLGSDAYTLVQYMPSEAAAQGCDVYVGPLGPVFHVVAPAESPGLPDNDGRNDAGERETTTWPMPDSGR